MYPIIDAHAHLWLRQNGLIDGRKVISKPNGRADFMGEERQMMPPYMLDGANTAEMFLSNMDYSRVSAAVITQEYMDGLQNDYLAEVAAKYPDRFLCCAMVDVREPGFLEQARQLIDSGFRAMKLPAQRLIMSDRRIWLTSEPMMELFDLLEKRGVILALELADGDLQVAEVEEVIAAHPDLKIAIGHFGMVTTPRWQEQIKIARHKNVMVESGGITWLFHKEFYPYRGAVAAIRESADLVGWDKLMWGSDYPRTMTAITYTMSYDFIEKTDEMTEDEKAAFLGLNAERFYGFERSRLIELPYIVNMVE